MEYTTSDGNGSTHSPGNIPMQSCDNFLEAIHQSCDNMIHRETIHFSSSSVIFFLVPKFGCDTHAATIYRRNRVLDQVHIIPNHPAILTRFASIRGDKKKVRDFGSEEDV